MKFYFSILFTFCFIEAGYAQTITGPSLHCATTQVNGNVIINWTNNTCPCGGLPTDSIYVSSNGINGPYRPLALIAAGSTSYLQTIGNGDDTAYYYYMVANCGCAGFTSLHSDTISNRNPQTPGINYVSVNPNGNTFISWQKGPSAQTFGYVIYQVVNGVDIPIDTVYGRNDTTFIIKNSSADNGSVSYTVAAIDSCGNIGPFNTLPQNTIYLTYAINSCAQTITLNWDTYNNWPGVQSYNIYDSINGAPSTFVATYGNDTLTGTIPNIVDQENICFWVVANEKGGGSYRSLSNLQCQLIHIMRPVTYSYIQRITTVSNNQVDMSFILNNNASLQGLILERSDDNISFYKIQYLPIPFPESPVLCSDKNIDAATTSFYYRLLAIDSCGDSTYSSSANNIVITGYAFSTVNNEVFWNPFNFQYGTLSDYNLYRTYNNLPYAIVFTADTPLYYKEYVGNLTPGSTNGAFCYYIIATDSVKYPNGMIDTTTCQSNIICLDQELTILVPNAIVVPNGKNNLFKPEFVFHDINSYDMQIYNRWGGLIFETGDYNQGWNGTYNSEYVEQGVYAYTITVTDTQNHTVQKAGTVMVIR
jgi:gliding motility-associated-like protein